MAYKYIERTYGKQFAPGQRVLLTEYGDKPGTVQHVNGDPRYVRVKFDDGLVGSCHPNGLKFPARDKESQP